MTTPTASILDTKLTLAIGMAHRNGYELPDEATVNRAARFLMETDTRAPSLTTATEIAVGPDGAIEVLLTTSRSIASFTFEPGEEQTEFVIEDRETGAIAEEEWLAADESLQRLAALTE